MNRLRYHQSRHYSYLQTRLVKTTVRLRPNAQVETFTGVYGPWKIEKEDVIEVWTYRMSLALVATSFSIGTVDVIYPSVFPSSLATPASFAGATGLGLSLALIHIYMTPLKRLLQAFWGIGLIGSLWLLMTAPESAGSFPLYIAHHNNSIWYIGPMFAALTGITFKEGICYGKAEAFALTALIPILLVGHLTQLFPTELEKSLSVVMAMLLLIFASRKFSQSVKEDIGDKSVFMFQRLPKEKQEERLREMGIDDL